GAVVDRGRRRGRAGRLVSIPAPRGARGRLRLERSRGARVDPRGTAGPDRPRPVHARDGRRRAARGHPLVPPPPDAARDRPHRARGQPPGRSRAAPQGERRPGEGQGHLRRHPSRRAGAVAPRARV
ncbi:MAG: hypothetical protein AVDCRST_MAG64-2393, partial [uncultured Phycisphaerae bacterium]